MVMMMIIIIIILLYSCAYSVQRGPMTERAQTYIKGGKSTT